MYALLALPASRLPTILALFLLSFPLLNLLPLLSWFQSSLPVQRLFYWDSLHFLFTSLNFLFKSHHLHNLLLTLVKLKSLSLNKLILQMLMLLIISLIKSHYLSTNTLNLLIMSTNQLFTPIKSRKTIVLN
jgi:hypothetical protein